MLTTIGTFRWIAMMLPISSYMSMICMMLWTVALTYWMFILSAAPLNPQPFSLIGSWTCSFAKVNHEEMSMPVHV